MEVASVHPSSPPAPVRKFILVASIAAGVQFGWALQLSLLTPYVQLLGIPHIWSAFIWLCGPVSGLLVQPIVGYYSDRCTSRFGRRRPFIAFGAALVAVAIVLIGFAADLGYMAGDSLAKPSKPRAVAIFVVGFWILDVANNMLQVDTKFIVFFKKNLFQFITQNILIWIFGDVSGSLQGILGRFIRRKYKKNGSCKCIVLIFHGCRERARLRRRIIPATLQGLSLHQNHRL